MFRNLSKVAKEIDSVSDAREDGGRTRKRSKRASGTESEGAAAGIGEIDGIKPRLLAWARYAPTLANSANISGWVATAATCPTGTIALTVLGVAGVARGAGTESGTESGTYWERARLTTGGRSADIELAIDGKVAAFLTLRGFEAVAFLFGALFGVVCGGDGVGLDVGLDVRFLRCGVASYRTTGVRLLACLGVSLRLLRLAVESEVSESICCNDLEPWTDWCSFHCDARRFCINRFFMVETSRGEGRVAICASGGGTGSKVSYNLYLRDSVLVQCQQRTPCK